MTENDDAQPGPEEIPRQLSRILASRTFATKPVVRPLLERLVNDTIAGKAGGKGYETLLGIEVFGKPADWHADKGNVVRQGMGNLRKSLRDYYNVEGAGEPIEIEFPERSGWAAKWFYRTTDNGKASVERLSTAFSYTFPAIARCRLVVAELEGCIEQHPTYAPAYGVLAEALLAFALCEASDDRWIREPVQRAEQAVATGMSLHRDTWRLHVMAGALHCCRFAWNEAGNSFETALHLSPRETQSHPWYVGFLFAVGRRPEAIGSVFCQPTPPMQLATFGVAWSLYLTRRFFEARRQLPMAQSHFRDRLRRELVSRESYAAERFDGWPSDILFACICLALDGEPEDRLPLDEQFRLTAPWDPREEAEVYAATGIKKSGVGAFHGLRALLSLMRRGTATAEDPWGRSINLGLEDIRSWRSPVSRALAHMGLGRPGEAIEALENACDMAHPLMVWLHLWPIFDPLRDEARFKALIKRMNLP